MCDFDRNITAEYSSEYFRREMLLKPNKKIYILRKTGLSVQEGAQVPVFPSREYTIINSIDGMDEFDDSSYLWKVYYSCVNRSLSLQIGDLICIRRNLYTSCYVFTDIDKDDESLDVLDVMNYFHFLDGYLDQERNELLDNLRKNGEVIDVDKLKTLKVKGDLDFSKDCFFTFSEDKANGALSNIFSSFHFFFLSPSSTDIEELNDNNNGAAYQSFPLVYSIFNKIRRDTPDARCFLMHSLDELLYLNKVRGDERVNAVS